MDSTDLILSFMAVCLFYLFIKPIMTIVFVILMIWYGFTILYYGISVILMISIIILKIMSYMLETCSSSSSSSPKN